MSKSISERVQMLLKMHNEKNLDLFKMKRGEMSMMMREHGLQRADFWKAKFHVKHSEDLTSVWQKDGF